MPWWLLGVSMVATTFAADTPNLVTDIVRKNGIAGNWVWWAFLLTGMLTVFFYARLWRRSGVMTDLEFYELRYGGKVAAFLRGFRSIYLGFVFNVMIMAVVNLAAIKIGAVLLGLEDLEVLLITGTITVLYSTLGGLKSVIITDFFQFAVALTGAIWAASVALDHPDVGGLSALMSNPAIADKLNFLPDINNWDLFMGILIIPLAVQWWSAWYPGAEPGGGGYIAQRMLSAKDEKHAFRATLFFNFAHYALRPWPWIIVALCSLVVFPDLESIQSAFPNVDPNTIDDDIAYPAMLSFLPVGVIGLVVASLASAYMSTISTHLNWGASYLVNDFYKRFVNPNSTEKKLIGVGRLSIVLMMICSSVLALSLDSALDGFNLLLQIGAGTGSIYILRWFWWRVNAYSEITGMIVSFIVAIVMSQVELAGHLELTIGVAITSFSWVFVTLITKPEPDSVLRAFYLKIGPGGLGWKSWLSNQEDLSPAPSEFASKLLAMALSISAIYGCLFSVGFFLKGNYSSALIALSVITVCLLALLKFRRDSL